MKKTEGNWALNKHARLPPNQTLILCFQEMRHCGELNHIMQKSGYHAMEFNWEVLFSLSIIWLWKKISKEVLFPIYNFVVDILKGDI